jgi:hypothetical protein
MKGSKGKANPKLANELLKRELVVADYDLSTTTNYQLIRYTHSSNQVNRPGPGA